jgi:hypothetical protein
MTDERWKTVAIVLAVVVAGLALIAVATSLPSGSASKTAAPSGSSAASAAAAASGTAGSAGASLAPSAGSGSSASTAPGTSASAGPSAKPTVPPSAGLAQITFSDFRLDAKADAAGVARTFTFKTDGPGSVTAKLTGKSPQGTTRFCLKVGKTAPLCRDWRSGTLTGTTSSKSQTTFVVTMIGIGIATPTVDLSLAFRAKEPAVTLTKGRFDGTAPEFDGYNGMGGKVKVRSGGSIATKAEWGGKPFDYTYTLVDLVEPSGGGVFTGNGVGMDRTDPVTASRSFGFSLANSDPGFGTTPLTLTIAWK